MHQNIFQVILLQLAARLTVSGSGRRGNGQCLGGRKGLNLTHHLLTATVRIEYLGKEGPEGILFTEQPAATESPTGVVRQFLRRNELSETLAQLTDRMAVNSRFLIGQFLAGGTGCAA